MKRICVFCGSSSGARLAYSQATRAMGTILGASGIALVYGGGKIGLMGVLADAALAAGGEVIGVIPHSLMLREVAHSGLTQLHVVETMHQRKALMADLSDAFIALPGGYGTLDELCEIVTWTKLGIHSKPALLVDVEGYWQPLLQMLDRATEEGFLRMENRGLVHSVPRVEDVLDALRDFRLPHLPQWVQAPER